VHNGKPYARAGIGVYFGPNDPRNVSEPIDGKQTNNTAEIKAILRACARLEPELLAAEEGRQYVIVTDSEYAIRCATTYGEKQAAAGWIAEIPNKDLVKRLYQTITDEPRFVLQKVVAHTGRMDRHSVGNSCADQLAYDAIGMGTKGLGLMTPPGGNGASPSFFATSRSAFGPTKRNTIQTADETAQAPRRRGTAKTALTTGKMGTVRTYLKVPFSQKDAAKASGARWDPEQRKWYITRSHTQHDRLVKQYGKG